MAGEFQITQSWVYQKGNVGPLPGGLKTSPVSVDVAGSNGVNDFQTLTTTPAALSLGALTGTLGWAWFYNADTAQTINLYTSAAGVIFAKLLPGEGAFLRLGSGITAPAAASVAGTPVLQYLILPP